MSESCDINLTWWYLLIVYITSKLTRPMRHDACRCSDVAKISKYSCITWSIINQYTDCISDHVAVTRKGRTCTSKLVCCSSIYVLMYVWLQGHRYKRLMRQSIILENKRVSLNNIVWFYIIWQPCIVQMCDVNNPTTDRLSGINLYVASKSFWCRHLIHSTNQILVSINC